MRNKRRAGGCELRLWKSGRIRVEGICVRTGGGEDARQDGGEAGG